MPLCVGTYLIQRHASIRTRSPARPRAWEATGPRAGPWIHPSIAFQVHRAPRPPRGGIAAAMGPAGPSHSVSIWEGQMRARCGEGAGNAESARQCRVPPLRPPGYGGSGATQRADKAGLGWGRAVCASGVPALKMGGRIRSPWTQTSPRTHSESRCKAPRVPAHLSAAEHLRSHGPSRVCEPGLVGDGRATKQSRCGPAVPTAPRCKPHNPGAE